MPRTTYYGTCALCKARKSKAAMKGHLVECFAAPEGIGKGEISDHLLLRVGSPCRPEYWLDLLADPVRELRELDAFLRWIWLECCGHMSAFSSRSRDKVEKGLGMAEAFPRKGTRLDYVYDFGSSTELEIRLLERVKAPPGPAIRLMARNEAPVFECMECGRPAEAVCGVCLCAMQAFFCGRHAAEHGCGEEMLLPVVNSPRMGVCGYTGPEPGDWDAPEETPPAPEPPWRARKPVKERPAPPARRAKSPAPEKAKQPGLFGEDDTPVRRRRRKRREPPAPPAGDEEWIAFDLSSPRKGSAKEAPPPNRIRRSGGTSAKQPWKSRNSPPGNGCPTATSSP